MNYEDILNDVQYKDWQMVLGYGEKDYFQWRFYADGEWQSTRKWLLSEHMTKSEIVSTAFKAALTAEEHECRETFRYKGKKIFGPHFDVDVLAEIAGKKVNLDLREPVTV